MGRIQRAGKASVSLFLLSFLPSFLAACAQSNPDAEAHGPAELAKRTIIYLGDEAFEVSALNASASSPSATPDDDDAPPEKGPNQKALDLQNARPPTKPANNKAANAPKASAPTPTPKPKPRPTPYDTEFVLTKVKDITVGLSSDINSPRIHNDEKSFIPASITKVLTTAVALHELGPEFKFKTVVSYTLDGARATNLTIVADGDPTPGTGNGIASDPKRLEKIAAALKARGIKEISGELMLLASDQRLESAVISNGVPDEDLRECYGAMSSAFNYRHNCALAWVNPKKGFTWESAGAGDFLDNVTEAEPAKRNSLGLGVVLGPDRALVGYRLYGTYFSAGPGRLALKLPIVNAAGWYGRGLMAQLKNAKIDISKLTLRSVDTAEDRAEAQRRASSATESQVFESPPLSTLLAATNKPSDNFIADALFKAVAIRKGNGGITLHQAAEGVIRQSFERWLKDDGKHDWNRELNFIDGAGLSTDNVATPRAYMAVLRQLTREPGFDTLWASLPIAGVDGTLGGRMVGTKAQGLVRAKTGTMRGSYQLAGYIPKKQGAQVVGYVPFVILTATTDRNRERVRRFQDVMVAKMVDAVLRDAGRN